MDIPEAMDGETQRRSAKTKETAVITEITMLKDSTRLEFKTEIDNEAIEHRMRVIFPTGLDTDAYYANTPFALVKRGIELPYNGDFNEIETNAFPNQGIIILQDQADAFALFNKGLYEVGVSEDPSHSVALTLFRSYRTEVGRHKGWLCYQKGPMTFEYAAEFTGPVADPASFMAVGEDWRTGIKAISTDKHTGEMPPHSAFFLKSNLPPSIIVSALKPGADGMTVLRLYHCGNKTVKGILGFMRHFNEAFLLDLKESRLGKVDMSGSKVYIEIEPGQILTIGLK
jgi:alpha-mannosidase/mannosylglycerate hydrolase